MAAGPFPSPNLWHHFQFRHLHYLVDGETGAVYSLDDAAAAAWQMAEGPASPSPPPALVERFGRKEAATAWREVVALRTRSCSRRHPWPGPDSPSITLGSAASAGFRICTPLKALCLLVAMECNLACRYCFAAPDWQRHGERRMSQEVARRAIDLLMEASGRSSALQIDFFGGEPTLNWEVVTDVTGYAAGRAAAAGKRINFTLTTNGLIWNEEIASFLNFYHFQVIFSLDGRPEIHDRFRRRLGGQRSHAAVLRNVRQAVQQLVDGDYWIRGTFTRENLDFTADVEYLLDQGFRRISLEPVVAVPGPDAPWALRDEDLPRLLSEYDRLAELYLRKAREGDPFEFFHFRLAPPSGPCVARRISGCGAGYQYLAVTPEGDLYPCHQFVGREAYRMGSIFDRGIEQSLSPTPTGDGSCGHLLSERFRRAHALGKPECRNCWARLYCGGGCHANADLLGGDMLGTVPLFCELQKKRVELSIALREACGTG